jgi:hypothetical protein
LYLTWSPWHFAGQNYGIALMFLGRSGVEVDSRTKRLLYGSFVLSFVLAFLALHVEGATNVYAPTRNAMGPQIELLRLGIPRNIALGSTVIVGLAYAACLAGALVPLWRKAGFARLLPAGALARRAGAGSGAGTSRREPDDRPGARNDPRVMYANAPARTPDAANVVNTFALDTRASTYCHSSASRRTSRESIRSTAE